MGDMIHITDVEPLAGHVLEITFSDGAIKQVDLSELLSAGGVLEPIDSDREVFASVTVNPESRTIEWPGGVDLDPDVLYGRFEPASGHRIERRIIREPYVST